MQEKILEEITKHCEECSLKERCPEEDCTLFRIEQIVLKDDDSNSKLQED